MIRAAGIPEELIDKVPILEAKDVAEAIIYALSTPPHVQVRIILRHTLYYKLSYTIPTPKFETNTLYTQYINFSVYNTSIDF